LVSKERGGGKRRSARSIIDRIDPSPQGRGGKGLLSFFAKKREKEKENKIRLASGRSEYLGALSFRSDHSRRKKREGHLAPLRFDIGREKEKGALSHKMAIFKHSAFINRWRDQGGGRPCCTYSFAEKKGEESNMLSYSGLSS